MSPALVRFSKYSLVGVGTFAFDLVLLAILIDLVSLNPVFSAAIAFLIAVSINYALSRHFVFKGTARSLGDGYAHFVLIAIAGLLLVIGGMYMLVTIFTWHYASARLLVAALTGFWNYIMNLFVNFKVAGKH